MSNQVKAVDYTNPHTIGQAWIEDSSLERWFPFSAERIKSLEQERDDLKKQLEKARGLLEEPELGGSSISTRLTVKSGFDWIHRRDAFLSTFKEK